MYELRSKCHTRGIWVLCDLWSPRDQTPERGTGGAERDGKRPDAAERDQTPVFFQDAEPRRRWWWRLRGSDRAASLQSVALKTPRQRSLCALYLKRLARCEHKISSFQHSGLRFKHRGETGLLTIPRGIIEGNNREKAYYPTLVQTARTEYKSIVHTDCHKYQAMKGYYFYSFIFTMACVETP